MTTNKIIYWTTKDGTKIDVDTMSESHLRNTLKMLIRNNPVKEPTASVVPFSKSEVDAITSRDTEYDDWMWKD